MKIVAVLGSPRKGGNSDTLAEAFLEQAQRLGAHILRFRLSKLNYSGCLACGGCKTEREECVLKDDLIPVLDAVRECDTLVVASPVYFLDVSSQMKGFVDRCYSFLCEPQIAGGAYTSRLSKGKSLVFVVSQRAEEAFFSDIPHRYNHVFKLIGFQPMHLIRGCRLGFRKDTAARREDLLKLTQETARKVMAGETPPWDIGPYPVPAV